MMNGNNERKTRAAMQFSAWLKKFAPDMHAAVIQRVGEAPRNGALNQLSDSWGLGQFPGEDAFVSTSRTTVSTTTNGDTTWYSDLFAMAKEAIPAYLAYDAQKDIMEMNIERAKQGLPPIDPGLTAPQVKVVMDIPPAARQVLLDFKSGGTKLLIWGALGLGAFFLIRQLR